MTVLWGLHGDTGNTDTDQMNNVYVHCKSVPFHIIKLFIFLIYFRFFFFCKDNFIKKPMSKSQLSSPICMELNRYMHDNDTLNE